MCPDADAALHSIENAHVLLSTHASVSNASWCESTMNNI